jgi:hypothetical protein
VVLGLKVLGVVQTVLSEWFDSGKYLRCCKETFSWNLVVILPKGFAIIAFAGSRH